MQRIKDESQSGDPSSGLRKRICFYDWRLMLKIPPHQRPLNDWELANDVQGNASQ
jgi:hypothetical protein